MEPPVWGGQGPYKDCRAADEWWMNAFPVAGHSGRTAWGEGLDRLDAEIVGSNPP
jgi:hypothetical protein